MSRPQVLALGMLGALVLFSGPPALAHGVCSVVKTVQTIGGFTPTLLDAWAFPAVLSPMPSTRIVREIVVCPSVVVAPVVVSPVVIGAPSVFPVVIGAPSVFPVVIGAPSVFPVVIGSPSVFPVVIGAPSVFPDPPAPVPPTPSGKSSEPVRASGPVVMGVVPHITVRDLATNPGQYDRQVVSVTGTIVASQAQLDARGTPYTELRLEAEGSVITVIMWGQAGVRTGMQARVVGPFYDVSPFVGAGGSSLRDVLDAQLIEAIH